MRHLLVLLMLWILGCSRPQRGEVIGVVRNQGQPIDNVLVTYIPDPDAKTVGKRASGVTDKEGRYFLQCEDRQPGVVVGTYRVTIEDLAIYSAPRDSEGTVLKMPPKRFPPSFSDPLRTPCKKQVTPGKQTIDLDLSR